MQVQERERIRQDELEYLRQRYGTGIALFRNNFTIFNIVKLFKIFENIEKY